MRTLGVESSTKIDLKDVSWWMSIKDVYRLGVPITTKLSKERRISLDVGGHLALHVKMIKTSVGLFQPKKHTPPKWAIKNMKFKA
jgi:hypothetical protein